MKPALGIIFILIGIFMAAAKFLQVLGTLLVIVGSALIFNHVRSKKSKEY